MSCRSAIRAKRLRMPLILAVVHDAVKAAPKPKLVEAGPKAKLGEVCPELKHVEAVPKPRLFKERINKYGGKHGHCHGFPFESLMTGHYDLTKTEGLKSTTREQQSESSSAVLTEPSLKFSDESESPPQSLRDFLLLQQRVDRMKQLESFLEKKNVCEWAVVSLINQHRNLRDIMNSHDPNHNSHDPLSHVVWLYDDPSKYDPSKSEGVPEKYKIEIREDASTFVFKIIEIANGHSIPIGEIHAYPEYFRQFLESQMSRKVSFTPDSGSEKEMQKVSVQKVVNFIKHVVQKELERKQEIRWSRDFCKSLLEDMYFLLSESGCGEAGPSSSGNTFDKPFRELIQAYEARACETAAPESMPATESDGTASTSSTDSEDGGKPISELEKQKEHLEKHQKQLKQRLNQKQSITEKKPSLIFRNFNKFCGRNPKSGQVEHNPKSTSQMEQKTKDQKDIIDKITLTTPLTLKKLGGVLEVRAPGVVDERKQFRIRLKVPESKEEEMELEIKQKHCTEIKQKLALLVKKVFGFFASRGVPDADSDCDSRNDFKASFFLGTTRDELLSDMREVSQYLAISRHLFSADELEAFEYLPQLLSVFSDESDTIPSSTKKNHTASLTNHANYANNENTNPIALLERSASRSEDIGDAPVTDAAPATATTQTAAPVTATSAAPARATSAAPATSTTAAADTSDHATTVAVSGETTSRIVSASDSGNAVSKGPAFKLQLPTTRSLSPVLESTSSMESFPLDVTTGI